jgi:hypothetical protein
MPFEDALAGPLAFYFFFVVVATGVVTVIGMALAKGVGQLRRSRAGSEQDRSGIRRR